MNVLIVDDTRTIPSLIEKSLTAYGYIPHILSSEQNVTAQLKSFPLALVIINTKLNNTDSNELCKEIRTNYPKTWILGIQSHGSWKDRVEFLQHGGDDCMSFPFPTQELLARIQTLQRRPRHSEKPAMTEGNLKIQPAHKRAYYRDSPISLTRREYLLLEYLMRNRRRTVTRTEILDHVWDYKRIINSNTVDVHIQKIRKKMRQISERTSPGPSPERSSKEDGPSNENKKKSHSSVRDTEIKTVHGIGYRLEGNLPRSERNGPLPVL